MGIDAQCGQSHDNLGGRLGGRHLAAAAAEGAESAVIVLHLGKTGDGPIHGLLHRWISAVVGSQRLQGHTGHIGIRLPYHWL